jgi:DedD protein
VQQTSVPPTYTTPTAAPNSSSNPPQSATPQSAGPDAGYFVQVAAVSKQEDAQALVESLKGHQYSAIIANSQADKLFHVQVGPFADIKDAEATRTKLVSDGYTPILKK